MTKARSFGKTEEQQKRETALKKAERFWELIECDFETLRRESKVEHPCKMRTLVRLQGNLKVLEEVYWELLKEQEKEQKYEKSPQI